jgi:CheY-like chemotaxis protein
MPDMDGLELIRAARKIGSPLHIVAISGGDSYGTSFLRAARQLGADVTLPKPFDIADLVAALGGVTPSPTSGRPDATNAHPTL